MYMCVWAHASVPHRLCHLIHSFHSQTLDEKSILNGNSLGCPELEQPWVRPDAMNAENLVEGVVVGKGRGGKLESYMWQIQLLAVIFHWTDLLLTFKLKYVALAFLLMINKYWINVQILHSIYHVVRIICCCCLVSRSCLTLCYPVDWSTPASSVLHCLLEFAKTMFIDSVMPSNHLIFCCPLLLLPSVFLNIRVFSKELAHHIMWPNFWSFSFSISPSNEHSRLISYRIELFDLFAVQETLKSLLQHHSSTASILQHSAFFMVQLSHMYMTTGKTIALTLAYFWVGQKVHSSFPKDAMEYRKLTFWPIQWISTHL